MNKGWKIYGMLIILILGLIVTGCGRSRPKPIYPEAHPGGQQEGNGYEGRMTMLAGGPEATERLKEPSNNYILHNQFPSLLVMRGSSRDKRIALTFDDGPDLRYTPQVLDILQKHHIQATFFLMGSRVAGHPEVVKRIHNEGHAIGNHTYWHPKLYQESLERLRWELKETDAAFIQTIGFVPKLFRSPYGGLNEELVREIGRLDYNIIGWSVDSLDWKQLNAEAVTSNVMSNIHPGAIILMHSGGHWTQDLSGMVEALDIIIPKLKEKGMLFTTIPELLNIEPKKKLN